MSSCLNWQPTRTTVRGGNLMANIEHGARYDALYPYCGFPFPFGPLGALLRRDAR